MVEGQDLERRQSPQCGWDRVCSAGFRQVITGNDVTSQTTSKTSKAIRRYLERWCRFFRTMSKSTNSIHGLSSTTVRTSKLQSRSFSLSFYVRSRLKLRERAFKTLSKLTLQYLTSANTCLLWKLRASDVF